MTEKQKFFILMKALFNGQKFKIKDYEIGMGENFTVGICYNNGIVDDFGIGSLIRIIAKMPDEDFIILAGENVLNGL